MPKSDGYKNLITNDRRSLDEVRKNSKKGGKRSGEVRRAKRSMREALEIMLLMSLKEGDEVDIKQIHALTGVQGKNVSVQDALLFAQLKKALNGDSRAFNLITNIVSLTEGEKSLQNKEKHSVLIEIVGQNDANES